MPYRCENCSHRFFLPNRAALGGFRPVHGVLAVVALLTVTVSVVVMKARAPLDESAPGAGSAGGNGFVLGQTVDAAESGDHEAQFRLGRKYMLDAAVDGQNGNLALEWLQRAAEGGHTGAMILLGRMFRSGIGALQNYELAARWTHQAALHDDAEAMLELGRLYRDGVGFDKNPILAYVWMNRAAARHHLEAARERESVSRQLDNDELKRAQTLSLETLDTDLETIAIEGTHDASVAP